MGRGPRRTSRGPLRADSTWEARTQDSRRTQIGPVQTGAPRMSARRPAHPHVRTVRVVGVVEQEVHEAYLFWAIPAINRQDLVLGAHAVRVERGLEPHPSQWSGPNALRCGDAASHRSLEIQDQAGVWHRGQVGRVGAVPSVPSLGTTTSEAPLSEASSATWSICLDDEPAGLRVREDHATLLGWRLG
jgi:hypothetical protein